MMLSSFLKCQIRDRESYLPNLEKLNNLERNFRVTCNLKTEISLTKSHNRTIMVLGLTERNWYIPKQRLFLKM